MDWSWAVEGITEEVPRTTGSECYNYMTNRRRWIEAILVVVVCIYILRWAVRRLDPIVVPPANQIDKPPSATRLFLLIAMTFVFGIEMGFKFAGKSVIFVLNPCHIQTVLQIYLLAARPSKLTIALFRIQMNNLNGPFLAFLFPEVESRTFPFEQATYWIQHALLYIIPVYIIKSGAYQIEDIRDWNWVTIGVMIMLLYHFILLNMLSIYTTINLNHMLCAALADPFQGQNYRIAAVIHESLLSPILNKVTVLILISCNNSKTEINKMPSEICVIHKSNQTDAEFERHMLYHQQHRRTPSEMSLAAEMAEATGEQVDAILTHRFRRLQTMPLNEADTLLDGELSGLPHKLDGNIATAITSDYTMPTTKID